MQHYVNLQPHNSLSLKGIAKYFVRVTNLEEIHQAISYCTSHKLKIHPLGGGSNIIIPQLTTGLVIYNRFVGKKLIKKNDDNVWIAVNSGENWDDLVKYTLEKKYYGLENLAKIPGTLGGAVIQNIGAYASELSQYLESVEYINTRDGSTHILSKIQCKFSYRESIFKQCLASKVFITKIILKLNCKFTPNINYKGLYEHFCATTKKIIAQDIYNKVSELRLSKIPDYKVAPNVGSFFKNPIITRDKLLRLQQQYPNIVNFKLNHNQTKLSAAWLIQTADLKGYTHTNVGVSEQHCLVIINQNIGITTKKDILELSEHIQNKVSQKFNIALEIEPIIW
jgi:UDP-N-acetylmuramate dehydrogenase